MNSIKIAAFGNRNENLAIWHELTQADKNSITLERLKIQFPSAIPSTEMLSEFEKIISYCRENNIKVIGIKFPLSDTYISLLQKTGFVFSQVDAVIKNTDLIIFQYTFMFSKEIENDRFFENMDHLNTIGGHILSERIVRDQ
ncbi:MAG: hypothetical protein EHM28_02290 [Spirochaetaceae bacterium]|nr:MAG: hypothetical protein EHM28_02290 [Spirochaetaceae bacterium]